MESSKTQPKNPADVMSTPNSGTTGEHAGCDDSLDTPSKHRGSIGTPDVRDVSLMKALHEKQLDKNWPYVGN